MSFTLQLGPFPFPHLQQERQASSPSTSFLGLPRCHWFLSSTEWIVLSLPEGWPWGPIPWLVPSTSKDPPSPRYHWKLPWFLSTTSISAMLSIHVSSLWQKLHGLYLMHVLYGQGKVTSHSAFHSLWVYSLLSLFFIQQSYGLRSAGVKANQQGEAVTFHSGSLCSFLKKCHHQAEGMGNSRKNTAFLPLLTK